MNMSRRAGLLGTSCVVLALCLVVSTTLVARSAASVAGSPRLTVMTQNLYIGADLTNLFSASSPSQFFDRMADAFVQVKATNFRKRAAAIADQIARYRPQVIGVQEAALWRTQSHADGPITPATTVAYDFLQILIDELASRGLTYRTAAVLDGFDFESPARMPTGLMDVRFTDRDAILVRDTAQFSFASPRTGRFNRSFGFTLGFLGQVNYPRGWQSIDITASATGQRIRFINTHLEVFSNSVQNAQVRQLISGRARTSLPVILTGDFNSPPLSSSTSTYGRLKTAGFTDAWRVAHPTSAGPTCCHDAELRNDESQLDARIDYVFTRGALTIRSTTIIGEVAADKTSNGLWPSDHAGLVVKLDLGGS
jgi:hypothetical protein